MPGGRADQVPDGRADQVIVIGLTGGIGCGKSIVAAGLVQRGAYLIDADAIVRELQSPGGEVLIAMVDRFGEQILSPDGSLDREAMAAIVFQTDKPETESAQSEQAQSEQAQSEQALSELNAIVHPPVGREINKRLLAAYQRHSEQAAQTPASAAAKTVPAKTVPAKPVPAKALPAKTVVVLDIPLLAEGLLKDQPPRYAISGVLVVDTPPETALERLVEFRGMARSDAQARMASQVTRSQRLSIADHVLDNSGSLDELEPRLDAAYAWALTLANTPAPGTSAPDTPAPDTPAPGTSAPGTSAPGTPTPGTSAPGTPAPG